MEANSYVFGSYRGKTGRVVFLPHPPPSWTGLIDDGSEDKKAKGTKKCIIKKKLKFKNYKNCLEATQLDNKINSLEKIEINVDSLKKDHKELIKNNKLK